MERLVDGDEGCIGQSGKLLFYDKTKKHNVKLTLARLVRTDTFGVFLIVRIDIIRTKDFSSSSSCSSTFLSFRPAHFNVQVVVVLIFLSRLSLLLRRSSSWSNPDSSFIEFLRRTNVSNPHSLALSHSSSPLLLTLRDQLSLPSSPLSLSLRGTTWWNYLYSLSVTLTHKLIFFSKNILSASP